MRLGSAQRLWTYSKLWVYQFCVFYIKLFINCKEDFLCHIQQLEEMALNQYLNSDRGNQFLPGSVTSVGENPIRPIPCIPGQHAMRLQCDILTGQRQYPFALDFHDQGLLFVVLQADWHFLTAEWLATLWSSANQLFGLLHNYIKAWSTAQP